MLRAASPRLFRFGVFELDLRSGELFKNGSKVRLHDKPFQLLAALLERPGEVVLREELRDRLWSADTFVDFDNNLNAAVRKVREALGDSADSPRFVETLPRRGYRFIAPVEERPDVSPSSDTAASPAPAPRASRAGIWAGGVAVLLVATVAGWFALSRPAPVASPPEGKIMLAVMPFISLDAGDEREYFGDGLTEELIAQLGRLQPDRLGVIARLSSMTYKGKDATVEQIGRELDVDYVIEGSVRSAEDRIRVTAQLIQVSDQTHLWAETYDRRFEQILDIQADVARRVASSLALELLPDEPLAHARAATGITEAYDEYLRGRKQWARFGEEGYRRAEEHFRRAIELDPEFPQAWAGLADTYNLLAFAGREPASTLDQAREAAREALAIDPDLPEAHNSIGFVRLYRDFDAEGAEAAFRRAVEISPNYAMAHHWRAGALAVLERHDDAIAAMQESLRLDPASLSVMSDLGWYYLFADRPDEALEVCERTLAVEAEYGWAKSCRDHALIRTGRTDEFLEAFRRQARDSGLPDTELARLDVPDDGEALRAARRMIFERERANASGGGADPVWLAMSFAEAGEADGAFDLLEEGLEARNPWLVFLRVDPRFDSLAADPRYDELSRRIGLGAR